MTNRREREEKTRHANCNLYLRRNADHRCSCPLRLTLMLAIAACLLLAPALAFRVPTTLALVRECPLTYPCRQISLLPQFRLQLHLPI